MTSAGRKHTAEPSIMALDIGAARTGVARANWPHGIPSPLTTILSDTLFVEKIRNLVEQYQVKLLIIGLPKGLNGQQTAQTVETGLMIEALKGALGLPVYSQDEALTSVKAESELKARKKPYTKEDIDMLSAVYILEDYLSAQRNKGEVA